MATVIEQAWDVCWLLYIIPILCCFIVAAVYGCRWLGVEVLCRSIQLVVCFRVCVCVCVSIVSLINPSDKLHTPAHILHYCWDYKHETMSSSNTCTCSDSITHCCCCYVKCNVSLCVSSLDTSLNKDIFWSPKSSFSIQKWGHLFTPDRWCPHCHTVSF